MKEEKTRRSSDRKMRMVWKEMARESKVIVVIIN